MALITCIGYGSTGTCNACAARSPDLRSVCAFSSIDSSYASTYKSAKNELPTTVHHTSGTYSNKNMNVKNQKQASDTAFSSGPAITSVSVYSESTNFVEAATSSISASIKYDPSKRVTNPTVSSKSGDVTESDETATCKSKCSDGDDTTNPEKVATKSGDGEDATKSDEAPNNKSGDAKSKEAATTSKSKSGDGEDTTTSGKAASSKSGDSPMLLFQGAPQVVKTSGAFQQVHTIYKIPGEVITNPSSNQSMYTSDIMRREVMTKYIPLSGISYAKKRANAAYKEYSVPSRIVPKCKKSEAFASYIVGLWRTKCHSKPICPVVYHTETDEIQIMGGISALNSYCVEALQSGALP